MTKIYDIIIVGGGLAGITAAIYAARKEIDFILIAPELGGEIQNTTYVENWPGIPKIDGRELANNYVEHLKSFNVNIIEDAVTEVTKGDTFKVKTYDAEFESKTLIWATGSKYRMLNVPGEEEMKSRGVTYCSICDGPLFKNKIVAVVGAGNNGLTSAIYMSEIASKVYLINKYPTIKGDQVLADQLINNPKVEIVYSANVKEIKGERLVTGIVLTDGKEIALQGVVVNVGYTPNTEPIKNVVQLDNAGYVAINQKGMTQTDGLFAAGDVVNNPYKQLAISAGQGCNAALGAYDYLKGMK